MKVVFCCLDGENLVGSRKKRATNKLVNANCLPEGSRVLLLSALRRSGRLAAYCGLFPVGGPRKRFPDDASLRLSFWNITQEATGFCLQRQPRCQNREGKIEKLTPAIKFLPCESFFKAAGLGRDA